MSANQYEIFQKIKLAPPVDPELFNTIAEETAKAFSGQKDKNKSSQLRRFYDELVIWNARVESREEDKKTQAIEEFLPYIKMIRAKIAYSGGRKLLTEDFVEVFGKIIGQINSPETLKNAKLFFEAYIGFAKAIEVQRNNQ